MESAACDAVIAAQHPSPEDGGPCATCAFRTGTEANQTEHTMLLAALCVEGDRFFHCHERPQLCRGYVAAINLRGVPNTEEQKRHAEMCGMAADLLAECITEASAEDEAKAARLKAGA